MNSVKVPPSHIYASQLRARSSSWLLQLPSSLPEKAAARLRPTARWCAWTWTPKSQCCSTRFQSGRSARLRLGGRWRRTPRSGPTAPSAVEPNLAKIGGSWDEPFNLPSDPELLLERTGYACMDEFEYPVGSVFEENTWYFYDDTCTPHSSSCHPTVVAKESCVESLQKHTVIVKTNVHFTRVAYDPNTAGAFRVGTITNPTGAELSVVTEDMIEQNRI